MVTIWYVDTADLGSLTRMLMCRIGFGQDKALYDECERVGIENLWKPLAVTF